MKLCVSVIGFNRYTGRVIVVREKQNEVEVINVPSGHVGSGEDPLEAARREFREETGLDIGPILRFAGTTYLKTPTNEYYTMVYACNLDEDFSLNPNDPDGDIISAEWVDQKEIVLLKPLFRNDLVAKKIQAGVIALESASDKIPFSPGDIGKIVSWFD
jgi:8-oxo-dGTP pyrophosphatase MutT (NUDIX family)